MIIFQWINLKIEEGWRGYLIMNLILKLVSPGLVSIEVLPAGGRRAALTVDGRKFRNRLQMLYDRETRRQVFGGVMREI